MKRKQFSVLEVKECFCVNILRTLRNPPPVLRSVMLTHFCSLIDLAEQSSSPSALRFVLLFLSCLPQRNVAVWRRG